MSDKRAKQSYKCKPQSGCEFETEADTRRILARQKRLQNDFINECIRLQSGKASPHDSRT